MIVEYDSTNTWLNFREEFSDRFLGPHFHDSLCSMLATVHQECIFPRSHPMYPMVLVASVLLSELSELWPTRVSPQEIVPFCLWRWKQSCSSFENKYSKFFPKVEIQHHQIDRRTMGTGFYVSLYVRQTIQKQTDVGLGNVREVLRTMSICIIAPMIPKPNRFDAFGYHVLIECQCCAISLLDLAGENENRDFQLNGCPNLGNKSQNCRTWHPAEEQISIPGSITIQYSRYHVGMDVSACGKQHYEKLTWNLAITCKKSSL